MINKTPHKLAVIGSPIGQSLSPKLHNYWMEKLDIDGLYITKDVPEGCLEQAVISMVDEGYTGWNVTIPHKQAMKKLTQSLDISAEQIGAVNTIVNEGGILKGYNTDADGFTAHLNKKAPNWRRDKPALVLGAGGAARALVYGLIKAGVETIFICNRSQDKAEQMAESFASCQVLKWDERSGIAAEAGLVVNATALGMLNMPPLEMSVNLCAADTVVYDIVYKPLVTELLVSAENRGLVTVDGLGMLYHQAAAAFSLWFNQEPPHDAFLEKLRVDSL